MLVLIPVKYIIFKEYSFWKEWKICALFKTKKNHIFIFYKTDDDDFVSDL